MANLDAKVPREKTQLRSFLRSCNVFRRLIKDFSNLSEPLTQWLRKYSKPEWGDHPQKRTQAVQNTEYKSHSSPNTHTCRQKVTYHVGHGLLVISTWCDAPPTAVQLESQGLATIGYWSRNISNTDQRYSASERQFLASVWSILTLCPYIEVTRFLDRSDQNLRSCLMDIDYPAGRLMR